MNEESGKAVYGQAEIQCRPRFGPAQACHLMVYLLVQPVVRCRARLAGLAAEHFAAGSTVFDTGLGLLWETAFEFESRHRIWPSLLALSSEFRVRWESRASAEVAEVYRSGVLSQAAAANQRDLPLDNGVDLLFEFMMEREVWGSIRREVDRLGSDVWVHPSAALQPYLDACVRIRAQCYPRDTAADMVQRLIGGEPPATAGRATG